MAADCGVFFGEAEGGSGGVEGEEVEAGLVEGADEEVHCFFFFFFFSFAFFPFGKRVGGGGGGGGLERFSGCTFLVSFCENGMVRGEESVEMEWFPLKNTSSSEEEQGVIIAI